VPRPLLRKPSLALQERPQVAMALHDDARAA